MATKFKVGIYTKTEGPVFNGVTFDTFDEATKAADITFLTWTAVTAVEIFEVPA